MNETRRNCTDCKREFRPTRDWQRFCSPLCRLRSHRKAVRDHASQQPQTKEGQTE